MPIDSEHCLLRRNALTKQSRRATCREPSRSALPAPLPEARRKTRRSAWRAALGLQSVSASASRPRRRGLRSLWRRQGLEVGRCRGRAAAGLPHACPPITQRILPCPSGRARAGAWSCKVANVEADRVAWSNQMCTGLGHIHESRLRPRTRTGSSVQHRCAMPLMNLASSFWQGASKHEAV